LRRKQKTHKNLQESEIARQGLAKGPAIAPFTKHFGQGRGGRAAADESEAIP